MLKNKKPDGPAPKDDVKVNDDSKDSKKTEDYSKPGTLPFTDLWGPDVKYSDQVANGDDDDDKEVEDEDDGEDDIVDDNGFVHQWVQLDDDVKAPKKDDKPAEKSFV